MNKFRVVAILAILMLYGSTNAQSNVSASTVPVRNLTMNDRTMNILAALAEKYRAVIGVYGTLLGSDKGVISISVEHGTLADVLNAIAAQDRRFEWHQADDGSIHVSTREAPLPVIDVLIPSFDAERLGRTEAVPQLTQVPEITSWLNLHHCSMDEMMAGHPPRNWEQFSVHIKDKPL